MTAREPKEPKRREEVAAFFTRHGYVVIYQDCRGRYGSEGVFRKYLDEAADGALLASESHGGSRRGGGSLRGIKEVASP